VAAVFGKPVTTATRLARVALDARTFPVLLGVALAGSGAVLAYASDAPEAPIGFKSAVEISGWLCAVVGALGFCVRLVRRSRNFAEALAAATALFTGGGMVYLSGYEWSDFPTANAEQLVVKAAPELWNSAVLPALPSLPAAAIAPTATAMSTAMASAPHGRLFSLATPARTTVKNACSGLTGVQSLQCLRCSSESGLSWLFCQEWARLEYCDGREESDPVCPSPIPVSPPG
jgi:hypothetical protein